MENHHSLQYQVSSTNMLNMCMLRWSDSLEKSWFEVITYSHNCYHNSDLWRRAGLHNVCCLGKNGAIRSSSKHPSNKSSTGSTLSVARWLFFGCATKKNKEVHSGPKTPCGTHGTRLLQLVGVSCAKNRSKVGWQQVKNTRILNAQQVAWTTCLQQIYFYVQVYLQFPIWNRLLDRRIAWSLDSKSTLHCTLHIISIPKIYIIHTSIATYKPMYYLYMMYTLYTLACGLFCSSIFLHTQIYNVRVLLATTSLVSLVHMSVILHRHDCAGWNGSKKSWFQRMKRRYQLTVN